MVDDKGRKPEDDDPDDDPDDDDPDDSTDKGNPLEEALARANAQAKRWRLRATGKDAAWAQKQGKTTPEPPKTGEGDTGKDAATLEREIRAKVEQEYADRASEGNLRAAVSTALAGMVELSEDQMSSPAKTRKAIQRVTNMIDMRSLHMDDDGEIEGLDEEIADLRRAYPGLFKGGASGKRQASTRGGDGAARSSKSAKSDDDGLTDVARAIFGGTSDD